MNIRKLKTKVRLSLSYITLVILSVIAIYPALWIVLGSVRQGRSLYSKSLIPESFTLEHYRDLFTSDTILYGHHFRTPAAQSHDHPFVILKSEQHHEISHPIQHAQATFVGQLCTPKDVLARNQHVAHVDIGDYVVFTLAGAYAWNISHQNFLMHEPPIFHYF